jgi:hypothetical protein
MNGMLATLPFVQNGKLKVLGVSKSTRVPLLPNVPTIAEQGVPGFESGTWQGALLPAGTPPEVVAKLNAELTRIIRSPEVRAAPDRAGRRGPHHDAGRVRGLLRPRAEALGDGRRGRRREARLTTPEQHEQDRHAHPCRPLPHASRTRSASACSPARR